MGEHRYDRPETDKTVQLTPQQEQLRQASVTKNVDITEIHPAFKKVSDKLGNGFV
jgi:hypothetical protein